MSHIHSPTCGCTTRRSLLSQGLASVGVLGGAGVLQGCARNELGRRSLNIVSDEDLEAASAQAWSDLKRQARLSQSPSINTLVQNVGSRIVDVSGVRGSPEFIVIEDDTPNAFVLPGARVAVHTGLLPIADAQSMLAAVLGHEIAHVTLKHANERISQQSLTSLAISIATQNGQDAGLAQALGLGAQLGVLLPYSRRHEVESDRLGVRYAHAAGFNPAAALTLWDRMAQAATVVPPPCYPAIQGPKIVKRLFALKSLICRI